MFTEYTLYDDLIRHTANTNNLCLFLQRCATFPHRGRLFGKGKPRHSGGFDTLLWVIRKVFRGRIGGRIGIGLLVGTMDIATANNTVAIVMAGPIARQISRDYNISPKESASLLDTFSCIFQGVIPYGAQILVAVSAAASLGVQISALEILPYLFYPYLLGICSLLHILIGGLKLK